MNAGKRVLIIDNDEFVLIELERTLEDAGFNTTTTWDIREAIRLLSQHNYDFVLMGECFNGTEAEHLLRRTTASGIAPQYVTLSGLSNPTEEKRPTGRPRTVCKRCPNDVLHAISAEDTKVLAHVA